MRLAGKTAVVTGAGTGIGRATAIRFAREGARVVVHSLSPDHAAETAAAIAATGGPSAVVLAGPVERAATATRLADVVQSEYGALDILVNNAGIDSFEPVGVVSEEAWRAVLEVNLHGVFLVTKALIEPLRRGGGAIVNVASASALVGSPGMAAYSASKGAIVALTRQMAVDYAADGLRVNAICPGSVDTPMLHEGPAMTADPDAARRRLIELHPLGRLGTADDVAAGALYLASDEASFVTGATLVIDGGMTIA